MASIVWRHTAPTAPNRQRNCCMKSSTLQHRPENNLCAAYHAICDELTESMATSNPSGTTDAVFTKLPRPLAKERPQKHFSQLATYLASFSVTYLATSLKLAKFSITERTAGMVLIFEGEGMRGRHARPRWQIRSPVASKLSLPSTIIRPVMCWSNHSVFNLLVRLQWLYTIQTVCCVHGLYGIVATSLSPEGLLQVQ